MGFPSFFMLMATQPYGARVGPICGARTSLAMPKKITAPWPPHRVESVSLGSPKQLSMSCLPSR
jgi:hypothetical protein